MTENQKDVLKKLILVGSENDRSEMLDLLVSSIEDKAEKEISSLTTLLMEKERQPVQQGSGYSGGYNAAELRELLSAMSLHLHQKIALIKLVRHVTGLGLKEAKDLVDNNVKF